jgi:hypothetical protein
VTQKPKSQTKTLIKTPTLLYTLTTHPPMGLYSADGRVLPVVRYAALRKQRSEPSGRLSDVHPTLLVRVVHRAGGMNQQ